MTAVLADTSVWIAHFRAASELLKELVVADRMLMHPLVLLELACGTPPAPRERSLGQLGALGQMPVATYDEVQVLIEKERLYDLGCGAIDISLLASVRLTPGARLWTLDHDLQAVANRLQVAYAPVVH
ncbi:MAG: PIN domain-containing protein [Rubrivivax sp.]